MAVKPITPQEALGRKFETMPDAVMESFNTLIIGNMRGDTSLVKQDDVIRLIMDKTHYKRQEIFDNGWLDIEPIYRDAGWEVEYEKPAYNEAFPARFIFRKGKTR